MNGIRHMRANPLSRTTFTTVNTFSPGERRRARRRRGTAGPEEAPPVRGAVVVVGTGLTVIGNSPRGRAAARTVLLRRRTGRRRGRGSADCTAGTPSRPRGTRDRDGVPAEIGRAHV